MDNGSPIGVNAAPKPIEKQAKMVKRISELRSREITLMIITSTIAAMIAVITLEASPKMMTVNAKKIRGDYILLIDKINFSS